MQISKVDAPSCRGGENPLWDSGGQVLYYIDNSGMKIHCHDPESGRNQSWQLPEVITTLGLRERGGAVVTLTSGIQFFDFHTGELQMVQPLGTPPDYVYNDGVVDRSGRFLIGASTNKFDDPQPDGGLFRLDVDHSLHRLDSGIHFSNSNSLSPDGNSLYFSDSWLKTAFAYDYDSETGAVSNRRTFVNTNSLGGLPDGAAVDVHGNVWIAIYGGAKIAVFRPDGSLMRSIDMPVSLVSSVAFGGPNLDRLFVTSIAEGALGEPVEEGAGDLYVVDGLKAHGLPENLFGG